MLFRSATLETALFGTPMVVVYKTSLPTYAIGKMLVQIDSIGLVNIVAGKKIVPELIQNDATPMRMYDTAKELLTNETKRGEMKHELSNMKTLLGTTGAAKRVAEGILRTMN